MENETTEPTATAEQQLHDQAAAAEKIEQFFKAFGEMFSTIEREQELIRESQKTLMANQVALSGLVERLTAQVSVISENQDRAAAAITSTGKLLPLMDQRVHLLTEFLNMHHDLFITHGWANPRPKGDPLAN